MPRVTIIIKPRGPILVQGDALLQRPDGSPIEPPPAKTPGTVKLCGCGRSQSLPFCDGSHKQESSNG